MRWFLILLSLGIPMALTTACDSTAGSGQTQSHTPTVSIEPQFQPVVDSFTAEGQNQGVDVTITDLVIKSVPSLNGAELGICQTDPSGATSPTIFVSQAYWDDLDSDAQEELLFHELGHCVLHRVHNNTLTGGLPVSMMNGVFLGSGLYVPNKAQYLHELFLQSNLPNAFPLSVPWNFLVPDFSAASNS